MDTVLLDDAWTRARTLLAVHDEYPYHNIAHTRRVMARAEYLAGREAFDSMQTEDLALACIFHDTGFADRYDANETFGAAHARDFLRARDFPPERISRVERLILATIPGSPARDPLEWAIQDSDLDNLGCDDGLERTGALYVELTRHAGRTLTRADWLRSTLVFFGRYEFRTETARGDREPVRRENVEKLKAIVHSENPK